MGAYNQPTAKPTKKVRNGTLGGGLAAVSMGLLAIFFPDQYALVPAGFEGGLAVVIGSAVSYFTKEGI